MKTVDDNRENFSPASGPLIGVGDNAVTWLGGIADTTTAIRASGGIDGGGRVQIDIPENMMAHVYPAVVGMRQKQLRVTLEIVAWGAAE